MAVKYNFTKDEFYSLKFVGSNPDIFLDSGLTVTVGENTDNIEKNTNDIITLSATTANKTDIGHTHVTSNIVDLPNYSGLTKYFYKTGGEIEGDVTITGKLAVNGGIITVSSTTVTTASNIIKINEGEAGAGVTAGSSGIEINRGSLPRYELKFYENDDIFRLGATGNTQAIATREDAPIGGNIPTWDDATRKFITTINPNNLSVTAHTHTTNKITDLNTYSGFTNYYLESEINNLLISKTNTGDTLTNTNNILSLSALTLTKILDDRTSGCITGATLTDNNNGTATINSFDVYLRDNPNYLGQINRYNITGGTFTFTDGVEEYVAVKYNNGSPILYKETSGATINNSDIIPIFTCWRQGNTIHSISFDSVGVGLANKLQSAEYHKSLYTRSSDGGLILGEALIPTARTITVSPALVYTGAIAQNVLAFNSSINTLTQAIVTNGVWSLKKT